MVKRRSNAERHKGPSAPKNTILYIYILYYNDIYINPAELHLGDGGRPGGRLLVEAPKNITYHICCTIIYCIYVHLAELPLGDRSPQKYIILYIWYYNIIYIYIYTWPSSISATEAVFLLRLAHVPMAPATLNSRDVITCAMKDEEDNAR